jgi:pimeloyl-ACP methyl ester carboxylesterase
MALALENGVDFAFMVATSCPVVDSVTQSAYQIEQQVLCAGYPPEEAERARDAYIQRERAQTYADYVPAARRLDENPVVRDDLDWGGVVPEAAFAPHPSTWEEFYSPTQSFSRLTMPVLAIFGEKDTQVNPVQGAEVYRCALQRANHPLSQVVVIPQADHNMRRTKTGCLKEQQETYGRPGGADYHPEFLETLGQWLGNLKHDWKTR